MIWTKVEELFSKQSTEGSLLLFLQCSGAEKMYLLKEQKNGKYYPQCNNRWNSSVCPIQKDKKIYCEDCEHINWKKLKSELLIDHLKGYREDGAE